VGPLTRWQRRLDIHLRSKRARCLGIPWGRKSRNRNKQVVGVGQSYPTSLSLYLPLNFYNDALVVPCNLTGFAWIAAFLTDEGIVWTVSQFEIVRGFGPCFGAKA